MDGGKQEVVAGHQRHELQSGRHRLLQLLEGLVDAGVHLRRIGTRSREYHEHSTGTVLDVRGKVVTHGTNLHLCHVTKVQHAATAGAQHDVVKLLNGLQRTLVLHGVLVGVCRLLSQ